MMNLTLDSFDASQSKKDINHLHQIFKALIGFVVVLK